MSTRKFAAIAALGFVGACASGPQSDTQLIADPFEDVNRAVFAFNETADAYVIGPAATAYETVTPKVVRIGIGNFLNNLGEPLDAANNILQGKPGRALDSSYRFVINSTVGVAGVWDASSYFGLEPVNEDFGQTLGVWGVDTGPFLVLPLLGPSSPRDAFGGVVDNLASPVNIPQYSGSAIGNSEDFEQTFEITSTVLGILNARVNLDAQFEQLRSQPEPYIALRRAYVQSRNAAIRDGQIDEESFDDLPDFE